MLRREKLCLCSSVKPNSNSRCMKSKSTTRVNVKQGHLTDVFGSKYEREPFRSLINKFTNLLINK